MDAMTLLHERSSMGKLAAPAPDRDQLDALYRAALRAPDHDTLTPWRFIEFSGEGLDRLGELYAKAEQRLNPHIDDGHLDAARKKPKRAPMIIAVIAKVTPDHPKVPRIEQLLSAGCAAHGILLAAQAQGLGVMWRTGHYAFDPTVREGLGLAEDDELVGFLYLGQMGGRHKPLPERDPSDFVERWS
ncbi:MULTISPECIES: nitroreductase family protein [Chromohalobacter]|uniref:Putative NAD(P)H nitroreductase n=1 Tax=Chromohalobacter canadensis TaxID=141389 RepID=A0ABZ0YBI9_9GAMM|nr:MULTISPECIES: nitroreductase family protein [Chromohalobacter]MCK0768096.1 nitroreductase family protein [Chromohalobacter canadensis]MCK2044822.1 nitroreductase family protein [Chromohalobacter moromii]MCT8467809.1 nitroreductase family protein [Chromohalobacter canadensis]MCT8470443.1 nitroreductase family protein [Chromohalobacter canadensis]MCT8498306.1 nitroreductase family protein [Chromohalobacter canadensis]